MQTLNTMNHRLVQLVVSRLCRVDARLAYLEHPTPFRHAQLCLGGSITFYLRVYIEFLIYFFNWRSWFCWLTSNKQVKKKFGHQSEVFFVVLTAIQFHLLFYSSRPLPNIFALALGKHRAYCLNKAEICFCKVFGNNRKLIRSSQKRK